MGNRVTVQDIADELGLSRNTVSKALNNTEGIAEDTRQRVLDKAVVTALPVLAATSSGVRSGASVSAGTSTTRPSCRT